MVRLIDLLRHSTGIYGNNMPINFTDFSQIPVQSSGITDIFGSYLKGYEGARLPQKLRQEEEQRRLANQLLGLQGENFAIQNRYLPQEKEQGLRKTEVEMLHRIAQTKHEYSQLTGQNISNQQAYRLLKLEQELDSAYNEEMPQGPQGYQGGQNSEKTSDNLLQENPDLWTNALRDAEMQRERASSSSNPEDISQALMNPGNRELAPENMFGNLRPSFSGMNPQQEIKSNPGNGEQYPSSADEISDAQPNTYAPAAPGEPEVYESNGDRVQIIRPSRPISPKMEELDRKVMGNPSLLSLAKKRNPNVGTVDHVKDGYLTSVTTLPSGTKIINTSQVGVRPSDLKYDEERAKVDAEALKNNETSYREISNMLDPINELTQRIQENPGLINEVTGRVNGHLNWDTGTEEGKKMAGAIEALNGLKTAAQGRMFKGALNGPEFNYILKNLPQSTDPTPVYLGKLEAVKTMLDVANKRLIMADDLMRTRRMSPIKAMETAKFAIDSEDIRTGNKKKLSGKELIVYVGSDGNEYSIPKGEEKDVEEWIKEQGNKK